jgi:Ca2+-transporting ATPase
VQGNLVTIIKEGELINTDEDNLRTDDIVVLQAGEIVPADLKLVDARGLEIDEFEITGEILPVIKKVDDQDGMIYMGSRVVRGTGKGVVVATGEQTENGRVLAQGWEQNKPYEFRIFKKNYLALIGLVLPAFIIQFVLSNNDFGVIVFYLLLALILMLLQNDALFNYLLVSNELNNLRRFNIQIRDARTLEGMNEIDLIGFDKTGVLTTREMEVKNIYFADKILDSDNVFHSLEESTAHVVKIACALCNDVFYFEKMALANPIDKALISFALKNGVNVKELLQQYKRIFDEPFDSENRYTASGFAFDNNVYYFAKGDPEIILRMCNYYITATGAKKKVDFGFWLLNNSTLDAISQDGDTAIALAYTSNITDETPREYTFLCMLQLENPLQRRVREIIREITKRGIRSILLTGDRADTAARIGMASEITRNSRAYLDGRTIEGMELSEVARQSEYCSVFARLTPSQKGVLIRLLQQKGHCVAMVGDGPNDGIALKVADIGISFVEKSSPIARRLSKILINNLADLLRLIESAHRIKWRSNRLRLLRTLLLAGSLLSIYGWIVVLQNI